MYNPIVTLHVKLRETGVVDRLGNEVISYADPISVTGCLFAPGSPQDMENSRPEGVTIEATAHFPKGFTEELTGALVSLDGELWLDVVGKPLPYPPHAIRGRWGFMVSLGGASG